MKHTRAVCDPEHDEMYGCMICNLFLCSACKCFEGSLPTECPGKPVEEEDQQLIYKSTLDFADDRWYNRSLKSWENVDILKRTEVEASIATLNDLRMKEIAS